MKFHVFSQTFIKWEQLFQHGNAEFIGKKKFLALEMVFEILHVHDNKMPKSIIYTVFHLLKVSLSTNPSFYHGLMQQQRLEDIVV